MLVCAWSWAKHSWSGEHSISGVFPSWMMINLHSIYSSVSSPHSMLFELMPVGLYALTNVSSSLYNFWSMHVCRCFLLLLRSLTLFINLYLHATNNTFFCIVKFCITFFPPSFFKVWRQWRTHFDVVYVILKSIHQPVRMKYSLWM